MLNASPVELVSLADELRDLAVDLDSVAVSTRNHRFVVAVCQRLLSTADYLRTVADLPPMPHGAAMESPFFLPENMEAEHAGTQSPPR